MTVTLTLTNGTIESFKVKDPDSINANVEGMVTFNISEIELVS